MHVISTKTITRAANTTQGGRQQWSRTMYSENRSPFHTYCIAPHHYVSKGQRQIGGHCFSTFEQAAAVICLHLMKCNFIDLYKGFDSIQMRRFVIPLANSLIKLYTNLYTKYFLSLRISPRCISKLTPCTDVVQFRQNQKQPVQPYSAGSNLKKKTTSV